MLHEDDVTACVLATLLATGLIIGALVAVLRRSVVWLNGLLVVHPLRAPLLLAPDPWLNSCVNRSGCVLLVRLPLPLLLLLLREGILLVKVSAALFIWILPGNRSVSLLVLRFTGIHGPCRTPVVTPCVLLGKLAMRALATTSKENRLMIMKTTTVNMPERF